MWNEQKWWANCNSPPRLAGRSHGDCPSTKQRQEKMDWGLPSSRPAPWLSTLDESQGSAYSQIVDRCVRNYFTSFPQVPVKTLWLIIRQQIESYNHLHCNTDVKTMPAPSLSTVYRLVHKHSATRLKNQRIDNRAMQRDLKVRTAQRPLLAPQQVNDNFYRMMKYRINDELLRLYKLIALLDVKVNLTRQTVPYDKHFPNLEEEVMKLHVQKIHARPPTKKKYQVNLRKIAPFPPSDKSANSTTSGLQHTGADAK